MLRLRSLSSFAVASLVVVCSLAHAATASASSTPPGHARRVARVVKSTKCVRPPVEIVVGGESSAVSLTKCDGTATPAAIDQLSLLTRQASSVRSPAAIPGKPTDPAALPQRVDVRIVERLASVVSHFSKDGARARVVLSAPGRTGRSTSPPSGSGHTLDFRIDGVNMDALTAYCKTLPDTGCARVPHAHVVRMQVREPDDAAPSLAPATEHGSSSSAKASPGDFI